MKMTVSEIKTVAVIGAGTMGQGIAYVFAFAGYRTIFYDVSVPARDAGLGKIKAIVDLAVSKGKLTEERANEILGLIVPVENDDEVHADLIIEAVIEDLQIKRQLFQKLEQANGGRSILASNTSSLSINEIASGLKYPERFLGIHFFNPAQLMQLVEVVPAKGTDPQIITITRALLEKTGKTVVLSADAPGFIVNRVARHFYLESLATLEDDVCTMEGIDGLLRSAGFKMGPFELMDLIGIDINYAVTKSVYAAFNNNPRFEPSAIQEKKVEEGKLGRKSGEGFYKYPPKTGA